MLVKHTNGQIIDYSMIVHLPVYGDLEAVKSSEYKTEFSGDSPAEIFMEFSDGTQLHTTDFVAENQVIDALIIHDKHINEKLADIAYKASQFPLWMGEVLKVWLCHDEFTDHWTVGIDYEDDNSLGGEGYVCIDSVKVYFMPTSHG